MFDLHEEMQKRQTGWREMVVSGLLKLAVIIRRSIELQEKAGDSDAERFHKEDVIARICAYISTHLQEDLSLNHMARTFHISPDHLIRKFKKEKGMTFHKYVLLQRVIESKRLILQHTEMKLTDIALLAGFASPSQFSKTFKTFVGLTPTEYREQSKGMETLKWIRRIK